MQKKYLKPIIHMNNNYIIDNLIKAKNMGYNLIVFFNIYFIFKQKKMLPLFALPINYSSPAPE